MANCLHWIGCSFLGSVPACSSFWTPTLCPEVPLKRIMWTNSERLGMPSDPWSPTTDAHKKCDTVIQGFWLTDFPVRNFTIKSLPTSFVILVTIRTAHFSPKLVGTLLLQNRDKDKFSESLHSVYADAHPKTATCDQANFEGCPSLKTRFSVQNKNAQVTSSSHNRQFKHQTLTQTVITLEFSQLNIWNADLCRTQMLG